MEKKQIVKPETYYFFKCGCIYNKEDPIIKDREKFRGRNRECPTHKQKTDCIRIRCVVCKHFFTPSCNGQYLCKKKECIKIRRSFYNRKYNKEHRKTDRPFTDKIICADCEKEVPITAGQWQKKRCNNCASIWTAERVRINAMRWNKKNQDLSGFVKKYRTFDMPMTLEEIAKEFKITTERARQIVARALIKFKRNWIVMYGKENPWFSGGEPWSFLLNKGFIKGSNYGK